MRNYKLSIMIGALLAISSVHASATEVLKWQGTPLNINLQPNQERIVRLPDNTLFRIPMELKEVLHVNSVAGVLYMKADTELKNVPVEAKLASSGEIVKLNITSKGEIKGTDDEVRIVMPWESTNTSQLASSGAMPTGVLPAEQGQDVTVAARTVDNGMTKMAMKKVTPNELIRYAAMRDFMPSRLWRKNSQIQSMPKVEHLNLRQLFYGESTGVFDANVEDTYRADGQYLYVITLKNKMPFPVDVRFDDLAIDFEYASVPEPYYGLGMSGNQNDFSYLYLITKDDIKTLMSNVDPDANR